MESFKTISEIFIWFLFIILVLSFVIPNVSSYFKKKLTGIEEEEKFDLDTLISQKVKLSQISPSHSFPPKSLGHQLMAQADPHILELIKEIDWGAGREFAHLEQLVELHETNDQAKQELKDNLRTTLKGLLLLEIEAPPLSRDELFQVIIAKTQMVLGQEIKSELSSIQKSLLKSTS